MRMDALITVTSAGLFAYWSQRTWLLLRDPESLVDETLENDLRFVRRLLP
jgi:hypothetical protein